MAAAAATVAAVTGLVAGCAETTVDPARTVATSGDGPPTTVFAPSGAALELLPELSTELSRLGALVVDNEGDEAALARIDALWAATRDEVRQTRPELEAGFESAIELARSAVDRRRPADADKAFNNLSSLVDAYVGDG